MVRTHRRIMTNTIRPIDLIMMQIVAYRIVNGAHNLLYIDWEE